MGRKANNQPEFDFLPVTVSIETLGNVSTPVILRGTPLPAKRSHVFSTAQANQQSVDVSVLLGESPLATKNTKIGSCLLKGIRPAPAGRPQINVTFEVDRFCNVKVEGVEKESGSKIETTLEKASSSLTPELIEQLLREAEENREEDQARAAMASAEVRVRRDQEKGSVTATITKLERLIAETGIALMQGNKALITQKTAELDRVLAQPEQAYQPFGFGFDNIFDAFFQDTSAKKTKRGRETTGRADSKTTKTQDMAPLAAVATHTTPLVQRLLEDIEPELERKRASSWEAVESDTADGAAQAAHSMREVLRQLLDKIAPTEEVREASWYKQPKSGPLVTRAMRIRYAVGGKSDVRSESTLSLINDLAAAVDSMYAKLSAESHSAKMGRVLDTKVYLAACETVISLIASQRQV